MADTRARLHRRGRSILILVLSLSAVAGLRAADEPQTASAPPGDAWSRSVALVEKGNFSAATELIAPLADSQPGLQNAAEWLNEYRQLEQKRMEMSAADCVKYVDWAQKRLERGDTKDLRFALSFARSALDNTTERPALLGADWMTKLREASLAKAGELQERGEWLDAYAIYSELASIYENDQPLEDAKHVCLSHARLDAMYGKDNPKWRERLQGVSPDAVEEALNWIDRRYVENADFRKLTLSGLQQMLLLADSKALRETFDSLKDDLQRNQFVDRVKARIEQVKAAPTLTSRKAGEHFRRLLNINQQTLNLPQELLISEFVIGATDALDEFTALIWPVEFKEFEKHTRGDFVGVGISISEMNGKITVVTPLEDTPAYEKGIQAGDEIVKVDGESTEGMSLTRAVQVITGPVDTSVTLTIHRKGVVKDFDVTLKRKLVKIQSVKGVSRDEADPQRWNFVLDAERGIGYFRVTTFQENTVEDVRQALADLQRKFSLKGLILDLRDNPGGLLSAAVEMADLFLPNGAKVVSTRNREGREDSIPASADGGYDDLPLLVLVNGGSASASEIVSGALKDHKRATLIGERTFGKFSVQNLIQLRGSDAHLKLTTAHYYLPSGRKMHHTPGATDWGVRPDVELKLVRKEYVKVLEMRRKVDVLGPAAAGEVAALDDEDEDAPGANPAHDAGATKGDEAAKPGDEEMSDKAVADADKPDADAEKIEKDPNDRPAVDPQLQAALLMLRIKLLSEQNPMVAQQRPKTDGAISPPRNSGHASDGG